MNIVRNKHTTTTLQLSHELREQIKIWSLILNKQMGEFIRMCVIEKIQSLNKKEGE